VILPQESVEAIWQAIEAAPSTAITVDLETRTVSYDDVTIAFELDDYTRWRLMEGLDDIGLTLNHTDSIAAFEAKRPAYKPTTLPIRI
jgi:3-isopropylmalate/(R)-2-methylmalate dehydratase small subunit